MFYIESIKIAIPNDLFLVVDYYMAIHIHVHYMFNIHKIHIYELHVANSSVYISCIATDLYGIDVQIRT